MLNETRLEKTKALLFAFINFSSDDQQPALTEEEFYAKANIMKQFIQSQCPISDEEYKAAIADLYQASIVEMSGTEALLEDTSSEHVLWLADAKINIDWALWNRYRQYLNQKKFWNDNLIRALDAATDKILDLSGDPRSDKAFSRRGLIMGSVQSGKTANYTALCCKAADAGYKVIIVLTGMLEDLRKQTQARLDAEFVFQGITKFTSVDNDFDRVWVRNNNLSLFEVNGTVLFVIKKNKRRLENLIAWLKNSLNGQNKIKLSLLLLDDEADNASINTNDPNDDPTAINGCIRRILDMFWQTTYIGITATPFANIFIEPESDNAALGDDLFPRDFIYALDVPDNYIGPDKVFDEKSNMLVPIDTLTPNGELDVKEYFPPRHKAGLLIDGLPGSLYDALNYFLLINAVLDHRNQKTSHRTMLIHVSRFTNVHDQIYDCVDKWLKAVLNEIKSYSQLRAEVADKNSPSISALHEIFDRFELEKFGSVSWEMLLKNYLGAAIKPIIVGLRNSRGEHKFDYRNAPAGLRVIAIGGNSFSRGLTLEGLCVTYFYRNARMYDTLMQMGRWFGYRPGYADLCRLWTTEEIIDSYGFINDASNELIGDIKTMSELGKSPKDFGLRVRQSPDDLMITARNKMRSGTSFTQPVSLSRQFLETPRLVRDKNILDGNENLIRAFVDYINQNATFDTNRERLFWRGVKKPFVAKLVREFKVNPWLLSFQGAAISDYILNKMDGKLWDVMIAEGIGGTYDKLPNVRPLKMIDRKIFVGDNEIMIGGNKIKIGTGGLSRTGLTDEQIQFARNAYYARTGKPRGSYVPDKDYMIAGRNPILFLYIIDIKKEQRIADIPNVLFALGVGLPDTGDIIQTVDYVINVVGQEQMLNEIDEENVEV